MGRSPNLATSNHSIELATVVDAASIATSSQTNDYRHNSELAPAVDAIPITSSGQTSKLAAFVDATSIAPSDQTNFYGPFNWYRKSRLDLLKRCCLDESCGCGGLGCFRDAQSSLQLLAKLPPWTWRMYHGDKSGQIEVGYHISPTCCNYHGSNTPGSPSLLNDISTAGYAKG